MFFGINMFWARLSLSSMPGEEKICSEKGPKHIYTHAERKNLPRLVALRNLFAIIVFSFPTALPYFGKFPESDQAP